MPDYGDHDLTLTYTGGEWVTLAPQGLRLNIVTKETMLRIDFKSWQQFNAFVQGIADHGAHYQRTIVPPDRSQ